MRTIICKKCGAEIDASLGECPICGAVYYILPDEEKKLEWAMSTEPDIDDTKILRAVETNLNHGEAGHGNRDFFNADNDELFNTRVWRQSEEQELDKTARIQTTEKAEPPVRRPVPQRPVRQAVKPEAAPRPAPVKTAPTEKDKEKELRKKQLMVAAVALVAVLTLVLSFMGGLFDFSKSDDGKGVMQNVVGMPQESAMTVLADGLGLVVSVEKEDSTQAAGIVTKQSIKKDKKVKKGDKITITVSSGKIPASVSGSGDYIEVPTLTQKTYDQAKQILTDMGLQITKGEDSFSNEDVGLVVSQSPMKGAKIKKGDAVTVSVSKGLEPSPSPADHTISVTAGKGGSISPKGAVMVADGEDQTFTITPDAGYEIFEVKVDGTSIGAPSSYSFTKVADDHTIYAVFRQTTSTSPTPTPTGTTNPASNTDIG